MEDKLKELYKKSDEITILCSEVRDLVQTIKDTLNYNFSTLEPSYHLVSVSELLYEKIKKLEESCDQLSGTILLTQYGKLTS